MVISHSFFLFLNNIFDKEKFFIRFNKYFQLLFYFHLFLSNLEIFTNLRWPISPYSKYITFFGREAGFSKYSLLTDFTLTYPTSFYLNPNNAAYVTLCFFSYFLIKSKAIYQKIILSILSFNIILYSASRSLTILFIMQVIAIIVLYKLLYKKNTIPKIKNLAISIFGGLVISIFILFSHAPSEKVKSFTGTPRAIVFYVANIIFNEDSEYLRKLSKYISSIEDDIPKGGKVGDGDKSSEMRIIEMNKYDLGLRYVMSKKLTQFINRSNLKGIGAGGLASVHFKFMERSYNLSAPHSFWYESFAELGLIVFTIMIILYFLAYIRIIISVIRTRRELNSTNFIFLCSFPFFTIGVLAISSANFFYPYCLYIILVIINDNYHGLGGGDGLETEFHSSRSLKDKALCQH